MPDAAAVEKHGKKCCIAKDLPLSGIMFEVSPLNLRTSFQVFR